MTDAEKRRENLLRQTRMLYSGKHMNPPVHPRFRSVNERILWEENGGDAKRGTLGVRTVIAILLFLLFVAMDYRKVETMHVDSNQIVQEIERQFIDIK